MLWTGLFFALLLLLAASFLFVWSSRLRGASGLPAGRVLQSDVGASGIPCKPLYSRRYGLAGKPDYLIATAQGHVPVEVKPTRAESEPHESHLLQTLAYCLLVEETEGKQPPYGLLRYSNQTFKVDYNRETRAYLLSVLAEMREALAQPEVHRNHGRAGRCRACAYSPVCEESLWAER